MQPSGTSIDVPVGSTVFAAAVDAGYRWPTVCGGQGSCRTCYMQVLEYPESFADPEAWESEGLAQLGSVGNPGDTFRLACQARVVAEATVFKRGVRRHVTAEPRKAE